MTTPILLCSNSNACLHCLFHYKTKQNKIQQQKTSKTHTTEKTVTFPSSAHCDTKDNVTEVFLCVNKDYSLEMCCHGAGSGSLEQG